MYRTDTASNINNYICNRTTNRINDPGRLKASDNLCYTASRDFLVRLSPRLPICTYRKYNNIRIL